MRYSILNVTVDQVIAVGGRDIKELPYVRIVFATLTSDQIARLEAQGAHVTAVKEVSVPVSPPRPVEAQPLYTMSDIVIAMAIDQLRAEVGLDLFGEGINIAVIDTGIRSTHSMVGDVVYSRNYTTSPDDDRFNHGTCVASIICSVAPRSKILNYKVIEDSGVGTEEYVTMAIDDILRLFSIGYEYAPRVINLSLGSPDDGNPNSPLRVACRAALNNNIWVVAAAGNGGPAAGTILSPACEEYVDAVGSANLETFTVSEFSSRGPTKEGLIKPDELMFGENLVVASSDSDTATTAKSGTSFAAPFISGVTALHLEMFSRPELRERIMQVVTAYGLDPTVVTEATPITLFDFLPMLSNIKPAGIPAGKDNDYGYGVYVAAQLLASFKEAVIPSVDISTVVPAVLSIGIISVLIKMVSKVK